MLFPGSSSDLYRLKRTGIVFGSSRNQLSDEPFISAGRGSLWPTPLLHSGQSFRRFRREAIEMLGVIGKNDSEVLAVLRRAVKDSEERVSLTALWALAVLPGDNLLDEDRRALKKFQERASSLFAESPRQSVQDACSMIYLLADALANETEYLSQFLSHRLRYARCCSADLIADLDEVSPELRTRARTLREKDACASRGSFTHVNDPALRREAQISYLWMHFD